MSEASSRPRRKATKRIVNEDGGGDDDDDDDDDDDMDINDNSNNKSNYNNVNDDDDDDDDAEHLPQSSRPKKKAKTSKTEAKLSTKKIKDKTIKNNKEDGEVVEALIHGADRNELEELIRLAYKSSSLPSLPSLFKIASLREHLHSAERLEEGIVVKQAESNYKSAATTGGKRKLST